MTAKKAKNQPKTSKCVLEEINRNKDGNYYIIFKLPKVARGMHGKSKGHVDEVLIVGVNQKYIDKFLRTHYKNEGKILEEIEGKEED